jgi:hypothetical protein
MRRGDVLAWIREHFTPPHSFGNTLPWHPSQISSPPHPAEPAGTAEKDFRRERLPNPNTPEENLLCSFVSLQKGHLSGESTIPSERPKFAPVNHLHLPEPQEGYVSPAGRLAEPDATRVKEKRKIFVQSFPPFFVSGPPKPAVEDACP